MPSLLYHAESDCLFVEQFEHIDWNHIEPCDDVSDQKWAVDRYNAEHPEGRLHLYSFTEEGLARCGVCGGAECSLTTDCPGEKIPYDMQDAICAGEIDFFSGVWL